MNDLRTTLIGKLTLVIFVTVLTTSVSPSFSDEPIDAIPTRGFRARWKLNRQTREKKSAQVQQQEEMLSKFQEKNKSYPPYPRINNPKLQKVSNDSLVNMVDLAIDISQKRVLTVNHHTPWQILHGTLAFRDQCMVSYNRKKMTSIEWLSTANPNVGNEYLFQRTNFGARTHKYSKPYDFEGHPNQFLGILAMCNLPLDHEFKVSDGGTVTIKQLIENAKKDLNPEEEVAWTLWFLSHYLHPNDEWTCRRGRFWNIERLVEEEIQSDVTRSACGGTHGLFALAFARNNYIRKSKKKLLTGVWMEAQQKLNRYIAEAKAIQRADGSFPTKYFKNVGSPKNVSERFASSGHMMEWLMMALPDERLKETWVRKGIYYLAQQAIQYRHHKIDCGPFYHAMDALVIYRDRVLHKKSPSELFDKPDIQLTEKIKAKPVTESKKLAKKEEKDMKDSEVAPNPKAMKVPFIAANNDDKGSSKTKIEPKRKLRPDKSLDSSMPKNGAASKLSKKATKSDQDLIAKKNMFPRNNLSENDNDSDVLSDKGWKKRSRQARRDQRAAQKDMGKSVSSNEFLPPLRVQQTAKNKKKIPTEEATVIR